MSEAINITVDNDRWNARIEAVADSEVFDIHDSGKSIPYIGWYWRTVDFAESWPIGDCGEFVGHMENNKWDYDMRYVTEEERLAALPLIAAIVDAGNDEALRAACEAYYLFCQELKV